MVLLVNEVILINVGGEAVAVNRASAIIHSFAVEGYESSVLCRQNREDGNQRIARRRQHTVQFAVPRRE